MKIGIITRHAIANYGSLLQSYASLKVFQKLGYDSEIINYIRYDESGKQNVLTNCHINTNSILGKIKKTIYFLIQYPNVHKMDIEFEKVGINIFDYRIESMVIWKN